MMAYAALTITPLAFHRLVDVRTFWLRWAVAEHPPGREIIARFPGAKRLEVPSHWNIPAPHGNLAAAAEAIFLSHNEQWHEVNLR